MRALDLRLLNEFQRGLPLCERAFRIVAAALGCTESEVLTQLRMLQASGAVSRVGAVFRPNCIGASTLAAIAVPQARLARVAAKVSAFSEVNHNYEREHPFNLWFVLTCASTEHLQRTLQQIEDVTSLPVMSLPLVREYRIDLGFDLQSRDCTVAPLTVGAPETKPPAPGLPAADGALIAALQSGLALVPRPYAELARRAGLTEQNVLERLAELLEQGVIKRFGVIVRHRDLGFTANAMAVFDVPDAEVDRAGEAIAATAVASLCYQRVRYAAQWRYNLFCMIHSRSRPDALQRLAALRTGHGLTSYPYAVLFSRHCYKQRGAHYLPTPALAYG